MNLSRTGVSNTQSMLLYDKQNQTMCSGTEHCLYTPKQVTQQKDNFHILSKYMTSTTKRQNIHIHQHSHNTKTMHRSKGTFNTERYNTITSHAPTKQRSHLDQSTTPLFPEPLPGTSTQPCRYSEHILTVNSPTRVAYPYLDD